MIFNDIEAGDFMRAFSALSDFKGKIVFKTQGKDVFLGEINTWYESDNGLEEDDELYEEYNAFAVEVHKIINNESRLFQEGRLYEFSYKNLPLKVETVGGEVLFEL